MEMHSSVLVNALFLVVAMLSLCSFIHYIVLLPNLELLKVSPTLGFPKNLQLVRQISLS